MASINFIFRPSTRKGRHPGSLSLRLIHSRQVKTLTLGGFRIYSDEWDKELQTLIYPADKPRRAAYLREVETRINNETDIITDFMLTLEKQGRYTLDDLLSVYRVKNDDGTLSGYAGKVSKAMENRGQWRTARAYRTVTRGLVAFNGGEDIPLNRINGCLIKDFETHLKEHGKLPNTISYYMRNLRAIYNKAVAEKVIVRRRDENPFAGVFVGVTKTMKRALSLDEIRYITDMDLPAMIRAENPGSPKCGYLSNLYAAQRYFSFCLYARGMCFIDMAYLQKSNIRSGIIRYIRKKTGRQIEVRVTPELQTIINSFADETTGSEYIFPIIRDVGKLPRIQYESGMRTQNERLKRLAEMAGLGKQISTHWARHSWASVGKLLHLPTTVIGEGLGHTSEGTTNIYLALLNNCVLDDANERITFAINHPQTAHRPCVAG